MNTNNSIPAYAKRYYTLTASVFTCGGSASVETGEDNSELVFDSYNGLEAFKSKPYFIVEIPYSGFHEGATAVVKVNEYLVSENSDSVDIAIVDTSSVESFKSEEEAFRFIPTHMHNWVIRLVVTPASLPKKPWYEQGEDA
jgi:hypothetical protein